MFPLSAELPALKAFPAADAAASAVAVRDLTVSYGHGRQATQVVKSVSFAVSEAETFGLVGESGSGKSTVLRAIAGLIGGWEGEILVDGKQQGKRRARGSFKDLQMVFQDPYGSLHPRKTVDQMLSESLIIHRIGDRNRRVAEVLEDVGLGPEFRFRFAHQLSGGQRQRVAIARAIILGPKVLLLDEPTSALDVSVQAEILNLLKRLSRELGLSYVLVSHDLAVIAHMCRRAAVMNAGRFVEEVTAEQLRSGQVEHPYTKQLLQASQGYDRASARGLRAFD
jgi:ABC-type dipeptide/oligopeptide/nickel transport system ATPase subunit